VDYFCGIFKMGPSLTRALLRDRQEEMNRENKKRENATVVTGDPEFRKVKGLVGIDWLGGKKEKDGIGDRRNDRAPTERP